MRVDNEVERVAHLVGVDDNVGRRVDGEEDVVHLGVDKVIFKTCCILIFLYFGFLYLDQNHHPGRVLLQSAILHHLYIICSLSRSSCYNSRSLPRSSYII